MAVARTKSGRNGGAAGRMAAPSGNRAIDLAGAALVRMRDAGLARAFDTWAYGQSLRGPMPDHMVLYPPELRPGRASAADALFQGRWFLPGGQVRAPGGSSPFAADPPSETWAEELHGFSWLRHFTAAHAANNGDTAQRYAQKLVADWIETEGNWHDIAWRPQVIGRRLTSWVANGALIIDGTELVYRSMLLRNMARQARHLARVAAIAPAGEPRITAAMGLAFSGLCLSEGHKRLKKGLVLLCRELDRQILADGGHVSRNPSAQLSILLDLISLRDALTARRIEVPKPVRNAIDRMTPMLRFFRHGDGRLALFNGSTEGPEGAIDAALERDDAKGRPFGFAPHSGYQRLAAGPASLVVDTGRAPPGPFSHEAHAGCLAFEMSAGRSRMIVNCGATKVLGPEWEAASRATAAHSTLVLADTSSARMLRGKISRLLLGARVMEGPVEVDSRRNENEAGVWLETAHDGYAGLFGLIHRRRFFLSATGEDLRGEDVLETAPQPRRPKPWQRRYWVKPPQDPEFAIRFHIHPDARISLAHDRMNVLVLLPNGDGWQFRARAGGGECEIAIEESVYLGSGDATRRAEQIVVAGRVFRGEARVNWAWRRLSTRNAGHPKREDAEVPELPELELPSRE
ncbi:MAG: heparinase II/III family protein [Parvibaculum sp.]|uniref:heparinase II/III family protein n=1 Tax=Parvibaculum sp. TaxID=2024848 RepID=UPI00326521F4